MDTISNREYAILVSKTVRNVWISILVNSVEMGISSIRRGAWLIVQPELYRMRTNVELKYVEDVSRLARTALIRLTTAHLALSTTISTPMVVSKPA